MVQSEGERLAADEAKIASTITEPFCDGTHAKVGVRAAEAAVAKKDESSNG